MTALPVEHGAVLAHLTEVKRHTHRHGTIFEVGRLASCPDRQIALGVTGAGATGAAALTERAYAEFSPSAMLFVGIAGALRDWLEIGDVVVATKILAYQGGRSEDAGFMARPDAWPTSHALEQLARRLPCDPAVCTALAVPEREGPGASIHFEAVAVGDVVLNSKKSSLSRQLRRNYNNAVAIEMESSGFALAAHQLGQVPIATVRGISDRADGSKSTTDGAGSQLVAARNAAAVAVALAAAAGGTADGQNAASGPGDRPSPGGSPASHHTTTIGGHARVGQQIEINHGPIENNWGDWS
jgi:nucleoside phosphorylase